MDEEEQFVNIDLNDDNICSVCKLETETGTLSFCHVCFELSIEGVSSASLLHSKSLRGHRDCFEKCHLIANQKLSRSRASRGAYQGLKLALSQQLSRLVQLAQNKDALSSAGGGARRGARLLRYGQQGEPRPLPQSDAQVPRYAPCWDRAAAATGPAAATGAEEAELLGESRCAGWTGEGGAELLGWTRSEEATQRRNHRKQGHSREELLMLSVAELHQLNGRLLKQIEEVFEELTAAVQEKDALASELHVRHVAIEQLFQNCAKLPWLHISRAGVKAHSAGGGSATGE